MMSEQQAAPDSVTSALPGDALRAGREKAGLTVHQVAAKLNLSPRVIEQMEGNLFAELGAPVYAKGYLRQYAQLAGCGEDQILSSYLAAMGQQNLIDPVPVPVTHHAIPSPRKPLPGWALWGVAALIVLAVVAVLMNLEPQNAVAKRIATSSTPVLAPASSAANADDMSSPLAAVMARVEAKAATVSDAEGAVADESEAGGAAVGAATDAEPANSNDVELSLAFGGDSWVEIYDVRQRKVMYEMGRKGLVRQMHGVPPLNVLLGSASQVNLTINGQKVPIPSRRTANDVARFTISADGSIE